MSGTDHMMYSGNRFHLFLQFDDPFAASSRAERGHRGLLRPGHLQRFPALAHAIAEWLVDKGRDARFDEGPGGLEVVFRVTVVDDQGVDLPHEFPGLFHDPGNLALFRRLPRELGSLSPHTDNFAVGKFTIPVEDLSVGDSVGIFGADDPDPDLPGRVLRPRFRLRLSSD